MRPGYGLLVATDKPLAACGGAIAAGGRAAAGPAPAPGSLGPRIQHCDSGGVSEPDSESESESWRVRVRLGVTPLSAASLSNGGWDGVSKSN